MYLYRGDMKVPPANVLTKLATLNINHKDNALLSIWANDKSFTSFDTSPDLAGIDESKLKQVH